MKAKLVLGALLLSALAACGDNDLVKCGDNTMLVGGECVGGGECGPGTVDDGTGTCVPDGSVVCADGTMFDTASGTCVPSNDVCGDGTVLVDGECRDPSVVMPDAEEAAEVNDQSSAGTITVPAIGAAGYVVHGCITPRNNNATADLDPWIINVTAPTVLEISADGVGGLAAGFAVFNLDKPELANYQRFGLDTLTDSAKRQVYLPLAGQYTIMMVDQRTILGLGAAGNASTCYYTTVKQVALPAPQTLTLPTTTGTDNGSVQVYRVTSAADGTIVRASMTTTSTVMTPAWVALRNSAFHGLATDLEGIAPGPTRFIGGVNNAQAADIVVDMEFNSAIAPQPFTIEAYTIGAAALPTAGGSVMVTRQNDVNPQDTIVDPANLALIRNMNLYYFDVTGTDAVVHYDLTTTQPAVMFVMRTDIIDNATGDFDVLAAVNQTTSGVAFNDQFIHFLKPGRYYVGFFSVGGVANTTYSASATLTEQAVSAVAVGDTLTAQPISAVTGSAFRRLDPQMAKWIQMTGGGANLGGDLSVLYYPADFEGWLKPNGPIPTDPPFNQTFLANGTTPAQGRIVLNYPLKPFLVRFSSTGTVAANPTFNYAVANRTFTDMMTTTEAAPATATAVNVPANSRVRFLVQSTGRATITTTASTFDAAIHWKLYNETDLAVIDANAAVGNEVAPNLPAILGYVAFEIENKGGTAGTINVAVTTRTVAPFVEICPAAGGTGTVILDDADDVLSAVQTLPFSFQFFATSVTQYKVSSNGWLTFNAALANTPANSAATAPASIPNANPPNGVIAGFWDDLQTTVCVRNDATRTIIEWSGFSWNDFPSTVQFEVSIYNTNNRVEWVFGSDQAADATAGTVDAVGGVENAAGTVGFELFRGNTLVRPGYGDAVLLP